jgi:hypothetical protein
LDAFFNELDFFVMMASGATGKEREDTVARSALIVKYWLHRLFYDVSFDRAVHPADDPEFYVALATFERRAGLKVDGKFTVAESQKLQFFSDVESETEVSAVIKSVVGGPTHVTAQGTWVLEGNDPLAFPVNRAEISCGRDVAQCVVFTANVGLPRDGPDSPNGYLLTTDVVYYDVFEWTRDQVQARSSSFCRQTTLVVNWATQTTHQITTDRTAAGCPLAGPLAKPRLVTLEDGFKTLREVFKRRKALVSSVSNSPLDRIRQLFEAGQAADRKGQD